MTGKEIEDLFHAAALVSEEEREAFLQSECRGDPKSIESVRSLLASQNGLDDFLETPAAELISGPQRSSIGNEYLPDNIGGYEIVRLIAVGGMGIVYEALQRAPRRSVALKLLRRGFRSEEAVRRFQREAQVLGRLSHPGIAQVIEAGLHDEVGESLPYFVMELLPEALSLTAYASTLGLGVRDRCELLCVVCGAVDHCHGLGVVHRDLKPDNILVPPDGRAKVIDFGVARVQLQVQSETFWQTAGAPFIGSIPYMSPEQVQGTPEGVDAQADVYALGVVAYELLSGRLPLDIEGVPPLEAARRIRDEEPAPLRSLDRRLSGDLETVVSTAMAKEKSRRYPSAAALRDDLGRFLAGQPILARRTGAFTQLAKFARRNRALSAGVAIAFIGMLAGGIAAGIQAHSAGQERDRAERALAESESVTSFLSSILQLANPKQHGRGFTLRKALDNAAKRIETELAGEPGARAKIHGTLAEAYWAMGEIGPAERHFRAALAALESTGSADPSDLSATSSQLAKLLVFGGRYDDAEALIRDLLERYGSSIEADAKLNSDIVGMRALIAVQLGVPDAVAQTRRALALCRSAYGERSTMAAVTLIQLASALQHADRDEPISLAREALAIRGSALGVRDATTIWSAFELASFLGARGQPKDLAEAETLLRSAIAAHADRFGADALEVATFLSELGNVLNRQGRIEEARRARFAALEKKRALLGDDHHEVAQTLHAIGGFLIEIGERTEAVKILERALAIRHKLLGASHPDTNRTRALLETVKEHG